MTERKKGHRICVKVAGDIKDFVKEALEKNGKVPPTQAKFLRKKAQMDARHHIEHDPSFSLGSGPAVEEKSSN